MVLNKPPLRAREEGGVWRQRHGESTQFQLSAFWTLSFHIQTQAVYPIDISMVKRSIHHCSTTRTQQKAGQTHKNNHMNNNWHKQANREFDRCSPGNLKKANSGTFDPGYQNNASQQTYTAFKTTDTLWKESAWLHARPVYRSVLHACMSSNSFCMSMLQWRITRYH